MFIIALLLLALHSVIFSDPGMERVFIDPEVAGRLGNRLIRLDRQVHRALFEFGGITFHRGFTHRPHLSSGTFVRVSVCPEEYSHIN